MTGARISPNGLPPRFLAYESDDSLLLLGAKQHLLERLSSYRAHIVLATTAIWVASCSLCRCVPFELTLSVRNCAAKGDFREGVRRVTH